MRILNNINRDKSIATRKLHYKKEWEDYFDTFVTALISISFISSSYFLYFFEINYDNQNDRFMAFVVLPIIVLFSIYLIYRQFTEFNLKKIETKLSKNLLHQSIIDYARSKEFKILKNSKNCIIIEKPKLNPINLKIVVLFPLDNCIYYTMINDCYKLNSPIVISHLFFARDFKKWLEENGNL